MSEDGVEYHFLAQPVRILRDADNHVTGVEFVATRLGDVDETGRREPEPIPGSNFVEPCDIVVEAVGEAIDFNIVPDSIQREGRYVWVDRATHRTSNPRVFGGGDVIGDRGNDGAAHSGILAAHTMDSILRDEPIARFDPRPIR
jgi:glutamate synthase (NADPH/NADH) small chain